MTARPASGPSARNRSGSASRQRVSRTAAVQAHPRTNAREWDKAAYRRGILGEGDLSRSNLFCAVFFDQRDDPDPDVLIDAVSSDGSLASFSLSSCIASFPVQASLQPVAAVLVDPVYIVQARSSPTSEPRHQVCPFVGAGRAPQR